MKNIMIAIIIPILLTISCQQGEIEESENQQASQTETQTQNENSSKEDILPDKIILAIVNGSPIYKDDLKGRSLQYAIDNEILYQEGLKRGLDKEFADQVRNYKRNVIINSIKQDLDSQLPPEKDISDIEIETYYNNNLKKYTTLHVEQISFKNADIKEEVLKLAMENQSLSSLVNPLNSKDDEIVFTDLGFNRKHNKKFDKIEVGEISELENKGGYIKLLKIVEIRKLTLDKVREPIKYNLQAIKKKNAVHKNIQNIAKENGYKVDILTPDEPKN